MTASAETDIFGGMMHETAELFKALGDETRLRILALLLSAGELCVCDLMETLQLPQSTVSRHLAYLKKRGLVLDRREGLWMYYSIKGKGKFTMSLIEFLSSNLPYLSAASDDLKRLRSFSDQNRCA